MTNPASPAPASPTTPVTISAPEVLSLRHGPSWMILALAAGATNAGAFLACQRFVTHVTGTVTRVGLDVGSWSLVAEYGLVLGAFVLGAFLSVFAIQGRTLRGLPARPWAPMAGVAGLLAAAALAGDAGLFGAMGGPVEEGADFALLCVVALAMGLMNATVASSTALAVRTTHMTGPATDAGVSLGVALFSRGAERAQALRLAALRGGKVLAFALGAAVMVELVGALNYLAFLVPASLVAAATLRSFVADATPEGEGLAGAQLSA